eukprot:sb/3479083/
MSSPNEGPPPPSAPVNAFQDNDGGSHPWKPYIVLLSKPSTGCPDATIINMNGNEAMGDLEMEDHQDMKQEWESSVAGITGATIVQEQSANGKTTLN